jgi:putative glutamine transport system substrate-binding protein
MKKYILSLLLIIVSAFGLKAQTLDTLKVYYYENYPYTYTEDGEINGLELEIMDEFINWMYKKKNISLTIVHRQYQDFNGFYTELKMGGPKVIGMGSVASSIEREKDLMFSEPYLKNLSVLISDGSIESVKSKNKEDILDIFELSNSKYCILSLGSTFSY